MQLEKSALPIWLQPLLASKFFEQCERHLNQKRNEVNLFCMDCACSLCPNCMIEHTNDGGTHNLLQVRHYVHSDVVRVNDVVRLLDIANIQPYVANGAKVIHLNPKNSKPCPDGVPKSYADGTPCIICARSISKSSLYCSIACKIMDPKNEGMFGIEENADTCDGSKLPVSGVKRPSAENEETSTSYTEPAPATEKINSTDEGPPKPKSFRKKSRKGIPRRAPFF